MRVTIVRSHVLSTSRRHRRCVLVVCAGELISKSKYKKLNNELPLPPHHHARKPFLVVTAGVCHRHCRWTTCEPNPSPINSKVLDLVTHRSTPPPPGALAVPAEDLVAGTAGNVTVDEKKQRKRQVDVKYLRPSMRATPSSSRLPVRARRCCR